MRLDSRVACSTVWPLKLRLPHRPYTTPSTTSTTNRPRRTAAASSAAPHPDPRPRPRQPTPPPPAPMPPKPARTLPTDLPIHSFPTAAALDAHLSTTHATTPGLYVRLAKKSAPSRTSTSLTAAQAVETALCYGWIDGGAGGGSDPADPHSWLLRFTPRRPKSLWSQRNVETVARLALQGRMQPAGVAAVEAAKADGRWARAYAGPATMEVPRDFADALAGAPAAERCFAALNRTARYSVLWRVHTASPTARAGRVVKLVEMLAEGKVPGARAQPKGIGDDAERVGKKSAGLQKAKKRTAAGATRQGSAQKQVDSTLKLQQSRDREPPRRAGLRPRS